MTLLSRGAPAPLPGSQAPAAPRTAAMGLDKGQIPRFVFQIPDQQQPGGPQPRENTRGSPEPHLPLPSWGNAGILLSLRTAGLGEQGPEDRETWAEGACCWPLPISPGL